MHKHILAHTRTLHNLIVCNRHEEAKHLLCMWTAIICMRLVHRVLASEKNLRETLDPFIPLAFSGFCSSTSRQNAQSTFIESQAFQKRPSLFSRKRKLRDGKTSCTNTLFFPPLEIASKNRQLFNSLTREYFSSLPVFFYLYKLKET